MRPKDKNSYIEYFLTRDKFGSMMGGKFISLSEDECIFEYQVDSNHFNPNGTLHGGALYGVMDSSQGMFVHYILDQTFKAAATGTATMKYLAPVTGGTVRIRTFLKEKQNRKIFVSSIATDPAGNEVATLDEIWIALLK